MGKKTRLAALLCAVIMALTLLPVQAWATETPRTCHQTYVNPLYADLYTEEDLLAQYEADSYAAYADDDSIPMFASEADAAAYVQEQLIQRVDTFTVGYWEKIDDLDTWFEGCFDIARSLMNKAMAHDPTNPCGGNYLSYQFGGYSVRCSQLSYNRVYFTYYNVRYYTTPEQEQEMDEAVPALLAELDLEGKSDYAKLAAIYDWLCANVTYDYDNLNDSSYKLKYCAYAALINRTAVCQGYAVLLYRLAMECGIDAQIITGSNHAWNIAKVGSLYYNLDATWGASCFYPRIFFLGGQSSFNLDHTASDKFQQPEFTAAFPISQLDYGYLDINGDGVGNDITDISCLYEYLTTGVKNSTFDDGFFSHAADVNGDGVTDVYDLQMLYEVVSKLRSMTV